MCEHYVWKQHQQVVSLSKQKTLNFFKKTLNALKTAQNFEFCALTSLILCKQECRISETEKLKIELMNF